MSPQRSRQSLESESHASAYTTAAMISADEKPYPRATIIIKFPKDMVTVLRKTKEKFR